MRASQTQRLGEPGGGGLFGKAAVLTSVERGEGWRARRKEWRPVGGTGCGRRTRSLNFLRPGKGRRGRQRAEMAPPAVPTRRQTSGAEGFSAALREVPKRTGVGVGARGKEEPQACSLRKKREGGDGGRLDTALG